MNSNCEMQGNVEFTVESEKCNPKFILKTHDNAGPPYTSHISDVSLVGKSKNFKKH